MGTSNFLYRDTLYALDTFVSEGECTCDATAIAVGCEHETDCPAVAGYHDEFLYDDIKSSIIGALDGYRKNNPNYTIYGDADGWTNDNRNFEGAIVGRIYKTITIEHEQASRSFDLTIGDDFCLRSGYYSGFNFDRVTSKYADLGTDELEAITDEIHANIFKYDELCFDDEDLSDEEIDAIKQEIYDNAVAEVKAFIDEADRIYHEIGEKYFDNYRVAARFGNGETWYEKIA